jgi:hypothetical protein
MSKLAKSPSAKKRAGAIAAAPAAGAQPVADRAARSRPDPQPRGAQQTKVAPKEPKADAGSKQSRIIAMLQAPSGATIAAIMKAAGWQQHSVRGFLAGVVRKRLKLKLSSKKVDGDRIYLIASGGSGKPAAREAKRRAA